MLFALAFLPMFGIGGLTGLPLGLAPPTFTLHDTYYVIGHFHYVVAPGHDLRDVRRHLLLVSEGHRPDDERPRSGGFTSGSFIFINVVFMPMFFQGLGGVNRRMYDGGAAVRAHQELLK